MSDWSAATFDGVRAAQRRDQRAVTPEQCMAWLAEMAEVALASGALARDRARRQREADELWAGHPGSKGI